MISEQTATRTPTRALHNLPLADMAVAVEVPGVRSTGCRKRLWAVAKQARATTIAVLGTFATQGNPSFFELERRTPADHRLGPGLSRESDSFWPLSEW
jgi:hypothetical protein